jgi:hypothetical protein
VFIPTSFLSCCLSCLSELTATLTIEPTVEALTVVVNAWNDSIASVEDVRDLVWSLVLDPLPPVLYTRHAETNALGLNKRKNKALTILMISATWTNKDDDGLVEDAMKTLVKNMTEATLRLGALDRYRYLNYAAPWQNAIGSYGRENVKKLRRIQAKYDPEDIFTDWVPGGFKIAKSERAQGWGRDL